MDIWSELHYAPQAWMANDPASSIPSEKLACFILHPSKSTTRGFKTILSFSMLMIVCRYATR